jgi:transcription elongation GreA/GreB family factor
MHTDMSSRVREQLEDELLRLLATDRLNLIEALETISDGPAGEAARSVSEAELEVVDQRIQAIRKYLATVHVADAGEVVQRDCLVTVDLGEGPQTLLICDIPVPGEDVIVADSPLGRAIMGVAVGTSVAYTTPTGPGSAAVLAVSSPRSDHE